jgi:hypothetical protein
MSKGILNFIAQRNAEAEAARIIGEAIAAARAVLKKAGCDDVDGTIQAICEADAE